MLVVMHKKGNTMYKLKWRSNGSFELIKGDDNAKLVEVNIEFPEGKSEAGGHTFTMWQVELT